MTTAIFVLLYMVAGSYEVSQPCSQCVQRPDDRWVVWLCWPIHMVGRILTQKAKG